MRRRATVVAGPTVEGFDQDRILVTEDGSVADLVGTSDDHFSIKVACGRVQSQDLRQSPEDVAHRPVLRRFL
jgi:hypothetical protein